jgi:hypothetical protein
MNHVNSVDVLNRLVVLHYRSLARYLGFASPTWRRGDERAREVLRQVAEDHQQTVDRLGELILELDGTVQSGGFPLSFASYHDLSFEFLCGKLLEHQRQIIGTIESCIPQLASTPLAQALAQESLGGAKAHLELLQEISGVSAPEAVGSGMTGKQA